MPDENCLICPSDCGGCIVAGSSTVAGFDTRIGVVGVGDSQLWQVTNPIGIALEGTSATLYRNSTTRQQTNAQRVEEFWFNLRTPERMAQTGWETMPVPISGSNQFTTSNPAGSWSFGPTTWTFFLAWDLGAGNIIVTNPTQVIVPLDAIQDPWSLPPYGPYPFNEPGHAEWRTGTISECPTFESAGVDLVFYVPWQGFCNPDCNNVYGYVFPVIEWPGFTTSGQPSVVHLRHGVAGTSAHVFGELGSFTVTASVWDQSMTNQSNLVHMTKHISKFRPICPNNSCDGFETFSSCPEDCAVSCGDGTCGAGEDCSNCKADCGVCPATCGDGICECNVTAAGVLEDCTTCVADCGVCQAPCGDGFCDQSADAELCDTCPQDCNTCPAPFCGDAVCDAGDTCANCAADCGTCVPVCGDGACDAGEDCSSCAADCGACAPVCGDGTCDAGEDCSSCAADCSACAPVCGDGTCDPGETVGNCRPDCGCLPDGELCSSNIECCRDRCRVKKGERICD